MTSELEPRWLSKELVLVLHQQSIAAFGGGLGIRDLGLLESAMSRPLHRFAYSQDTDMFELAAVYCSGIVKNHPFVDGNKRTGLLADRSFLFLNGYILNPDEVTTVQMIEGHAAGEVDETQLAEWIRNNSVKKDD